MVRVRYGLFAISIFISAMGCHNNETPPGEADIIVQVAENGADKSLLQQAEAAAADENWDLALELAKRGMQSEPENPTFLVLQAEAYDGKNGVLTAFADFDRALKDNPPLPAPPTALPLAPGGTPPPAEPAPTSDAPPPPLVLPISPVPPPVSAPSLGPPQTESVRRD